MLFDELPASFDQKSYFEKCRSRTFLNICGITTGINGRCKCTFHIQISSAWLSWCRQYYLWPSKYVARDSFVPHNQPWIPNRYSFTEIPNIPFADRIKIFSYFLSGDLYAPSPPPGSPPDKEKYLEEIGRTEEADDSAPSPLEEQVIDQSPFWSGLITSSGSPEEISFAVNAFILSGPNPMFSMGAKLITDGIERPISDRLVSSLDSAKTLTLLCFEPRGEEDRHHYDTRVHELHTLDNCLTLETPTEGDTCSFYLIPFMRDDGISNPRMNELLTGLLDGIFMTGDYYLIGLIAQSSISSSDDEEDNGKIFNHLSFIQYIQAQNHRLLASLIFTYNNLFSNTFSVAIPQYTVMCCLLKRIRNLNQT